MLDMIKGIGTKALLGSAAVFGLYMIFSNTGGSSNQKTPAQKQTLNGTPRKGTAKKKCATVKV